MDLQPRLDQPKHRPQSPGEHFVIVHSRHIVGRDPVEPAQSLADEQSRKWRQIIAPPAIAYQGFQTALFIPHPVESSRHALEGYVYPAIFKWISAEARTLVLTALRSFIGMTVPVAEAVVPHSVTDESRFVSMIVKKAQRVELSRSIGNIVRNIDHLPFRVLPYAVEQFPPGLDALVPVVAGSDLRPFEPPVLALA
jgi:hypothetical protein